jgi:taurine dioxygenase
LGPVLRGSLDNYLVSNVHEDGLLGKRELLFHNDIPYVPAPYLGASLHALEVDDGVSATRFASSFRAWERLPDDLKRRVENLNALHIKGRAIGQRTRMTDLKPGDACAVHALIGRQEQTDRRYIFACVEMTGLIAGLPEAESEAVLQELFSHLYAPEEIYEHRWQVGDIVIWNNLAIQHARSEISGGRRTLQRVSIAEHGYWDQYPVDRPIYDAMQEVKNGTMVL